MWKGVKYYSAALKFVMYFGIFFKNVQHDVWKDCHIVSQPCDVMVQPEMQDDFEDKLKVGSYFLCQISLMYPYNCQVWFE